MIDEKFDEKEIEKQEEKSPEEKGYNEKYHRDPLGGIVWALILIWAGAVFLAANLGILDQWIRTDAKLPVLLSRLGGVWPIVLVGAALILIAEVVIRLLVPVYRKPVGGAIFLAIVFIAIALGDLISWSIVGPLILIALGLWIIFRSLLRRR
jgi:hypothetical protein